MFDRKRDNDDFLPDKELDDVDFEELDDDWDDFVDDDWCDKDSEEIFEDDDWDEELN